MIYSQLYFIFNICIYLKTMDKQLKILKELYEYNNKIILHEYI